MRAGIGFNNEMNAFASGVRISEQALRDGKIAEPDIAFAFCSSEVDGFQLLQGIHSVLGKDVPVLGGSSVGIITNNIISYSGYPAGIVVVEDATMQVQVSVAGGLDDDGRLTGRNLASGLSVRERDTVLLFYDSVRKPPTETAPPQLNSSIPLIKGIADGLDRDIPIIGAGLLGDYNFAASLLFAGDRVESQCATAAILRGDFATEVRIMHGCSPKDGIYHTITRVEGPVIHEIDDRPAQEVITAIYGNERWKKQTPLKRLTIGVNLGEGIWDEFNEQNYVNRLILGPSENESGIVIFEEGLEEGTKFQFMLRDPLKMVESAKNNTEAMIDEIVKSGKTPLWGFYIDCAGRSAEWSEIIDEEAAEIQKILNRNNIPLFGIYSGVEIAPFLHENRGLDWTGVLTVFSV